MKWIEVVGAISKRPILVNVEYIQSVYEYDGKTVIDLGNYAENMVVPEMTYEEVRELLTGGEYWKK